MMSKFDPKIDVTVIIHVKNKEINLPFALDSCKQYFKCVLVVDSGSDDRTKAIVEESNVEYLYLKGNRETLVTNRNYVLENYPFETEWVFVLDADEQIPADLRAEIFEKISLESNLDGYWVCYKNIFLGRWCKRSSIYPNWNMRLFKHEKLRYEDRLVNAHINITNERAGWLHCHFIHDDKRGFIQYLKRIVDLCAAKPELKIVWHLARSKYRFQIIREKGLRVCTRIAINIRILWRS
ncbi:glycosyltransferase [Shewanella sp.]|uniref:glycosyltransferase n=1 Tax=Shewanella sp. TaxID=50422 RepID=UPI004048DA3A